MQLSLYDTLESEHKEVAVYSGELLASEVKSDDIEECFEDFSEEGEVDLLYKVMKEENVKLNDFTRSQIKILLALQSPEFYAMSTCELAKALHVSVNTLRYAMTNEKFAKIYLRLQLANVLLATHNVDKVVISKATNSEDATDKWCDLFYRRSGLFDGKKGSLNVNILNNVGGDIGRKHLCPADTFFKK